MAEKDEVSVSINNGQLRTIVNSSSENTSLHLWRLSDVNQKNEERLYISGWTTEKTHKLNINKPGTYYVEILNQDTGKRIQSERITISYAELFKTDNDELADEMMLQRQNIEVLERLMQKMFITGKKALTTEIKELVNGKKTFLFADTESAERVANMVYSLDFFDAAIKIDDFIANDLSKVGYQISATFRMEYKSYKSVMKKLDVDSVIIAVIEDESDERTKMALASFEKVGATVIRIQTVVARAYTSSVVVDPLSELSSQGVKLCYVQFPRVTFIKNKSAGEEVAAKTTIAKIRSEINVDVIPEALKGISNDPDYAKQVISGWNTQSKEGSYDVLQDKKEKYVNITNGHREIPVDMNQSSDKTIYFFGNSVMYGIGSDDYNTLPSLFSQLIKNNKYKYHVVNMANFSMNDFIRGTNYVKSIMFKPGDIVVFGAHLALNERQKDRLNGEYFNMQPFFERPHDMGEVFLDMTHMNRIGYNKMANEFYKYFVDNLFEAKKEVETQWNLPTWIKSLTPLVRQRKK